MRDYSMPLERRCEHGKRPIINQQSDWWSIRAQRPASLPATWLLALERLCKSRRVVPIHYLDDQSCPASITSTQCQRARATRSRAVHRLLITRTHNKLSRMKPKPKNLLHEICIRAIARLKTVLIAVPFLLPINAHASMFKGEALDTVADVMTWVVLIVAPVVAIAVFLLIHILPEKIAEKKQHPQTHAIQCLCLLSLVFGGMLWPIAWLWAYTKPVLHQLAYGTDKVAHGKEEAKSLPVHSSVNNDAKGGATEEVNQLRQRIAELETKLASTSAAEGGKG
jgi:hypothetical protein